MRRCLRGALAGTVLLLPLAVAACGGDDEPTGPDSPGEPASLTLSAETVHLTAIGAAYPLTATVLDANRTVVGDAAVSWTSEDESVATVDGSGRVVAVGEGETEVTASAGGASASADVIVTQSAASVSASPALGELSAIGDSVRYTATVRDANGHAIDGAAVEWTSGDTTVAAVSGDGWATARTNGNARIRAAVGDITDDAAVAVEQVVASVEVTPADETLGKGETTRLGATAADANGVAVPGATVVWTTSDPAAATVDAAGNVMATGWAADATITATVDGMSATADVSVLDQLVVTRYLGSHVGYDLHLMDADGGNPVNLSDAPLADDDPTWSPDGTQIAFLTARDGPYQVYVMDPDGSNPISVSGDTSVNDYTTAWRPRP